jgi:CBS domain-containing protein
MKVSEVMTRDVKVVAPNDTVRRAAQIMDDLNVGALPVCDGQILVGMITDRDITIRATAGGKAPDQARVSDVMSTDVRWCFEDDGVDEVIRKMSDFTNPARSSRKQGQEAGRNRCPWRSRHRPGAGSRIRVKEHIGAFRARPLSCRATSAQS